MNADYNRFLHVLEDELFNNNIRQFAILKAIVHCENRCIFLKLRGFLRWILGGRFAQEALLVYDDIRGSLNSHKPLLHKEVHYVETQSSNGINIVKPSQLSQKNRQQFVSAGQNPVVPAAVHKIFKLTDKRGVLVVDRGFDGWVMFEDWLDSKYRFVARLVGKRHLLRKSLGENP